MNSVSKFFFRRVTLSFVLGGLFLVLFVILIRTVTGYSSRVQNVKSIVAKTIITCLQENLDNPVKCKAYTNRLQKKISSLAYQIWVLDSQKNIIFKNSEDQIPDTTEAFGTIDNQYILLDPKNLSVFKIPNGYMDDLETGLR